MAAQLPHVVIVGAGFGGLYAARALGQVPVRVTIVDRRNHHLFLPLLYQVATAGLNPGDIATPVRRVLRRQTNTRVLLGEVRRVDPAARAVELTGGSRLFYDFLILAAGSVPSWFGHDDWTPHAPPLMGLEDAVEIRRRILLAYEMAEWETDASVRRALLTFVVVGGGPTGVELAGAVSEMSRLAMSRDFRNIDPREARIILLEGGPRLLSAFPEDLSARAAGSLKKLGVEVRTDAKVTAVDARGVGLGDERLPARTVMWAAGVAASPLGSGLGVPLARGRVAVEPDLSVPGHPEIFVVGDLAAVKRGDGLVPWLAPAAIQQGRHAARNIARTLAGLPRLPFHYRDRGALATIGRSAAVADFGRVKLWGWIAWVGWLVVHIFFLIGFRNRFLVLFQWAWAYLTYDRGARLLTARDAALLDREPVEAAAEKPPAGGKPR
ncbi:MAG: NAD(P)/FAD-dependent oxidoreductase [Candidatus Polarisedimenticolia bacterium]